MWGKLSQPTTIILLFSKKMDYLSVNENLQFNIGKIKYLLGKLYHQDNVNWGTATLYFDRSKETPLVIKPLNL